MVSNINTVETSSRSLFCQKGKAYFKQERGQIVRVNLDTFEEVVLDKLADNIADFLVDENQTITYLTSQGELRQENPDNSSIPKTCVNLKTDSTTGAEWHSILKLRDHIICNYYKSTPTKHNTLILLNEESDEPNSLKVCQYLQMNVHFFTPPKESKHHSHQDPKIYKMTAAEVRGVAFILAPVYLGSLEVLTINRDKLIRVKTLECTESSLL